MFFLVHLKLSHAAVEKNVACDNLRYTRFFATAITRKVIINLPQFIPRSKNSQRLGKSLFVHHPSLKQKAYTVHF